MRIGRFFSVLVAFIMVLASFSSAKASTGIANPAKKFVISKEAIEVDKSSDLEIVETTLVQNPSKEKLGDNSQKPFSLISLTLPENQKAAPDKIFVDLACYEFSHVIKYLLAENIELGYEIALKADEDISRKVADNQLEIARLRKAVRHYCP